jgi:hypothetical protein
MTDLVKTKPLKLNPKQKKTIQLWTDEQSETFGNLYQSAVKAGFRPSYSLKLSANRPIWLSEIVMANYEPAQIRQGIQNIAKSAIDSRSPDDTRLKAYEILAKITGIIDNKGGTTTNILVQPILNGESVKQSKQDRVIIDQDNS